MQNSIGRTRNNKTEERFKNQPCKQHDNFENQKLSPTNDINTTINKTFQQLDESS